MQFVQFKKREKLTLPLQFGLKLNIETHLNATVGTNENQAQLNDLVTGNY